jgi:pSer/pThr/pTyr-binding forkhead associated (FHA) protein
MPSLVVISGPEVGKVIAVDRSLVLGRAETDVIIDDPELSRRHLEVRPEGDLLLVEDLGSTNGTFIREQRIEGPIRLKQGDQLTLGVTVLEVREAAGAAPATAPESLVDEVGGDEVAAFEMSSRRRRRGLASRSWVPVALSFSTAILTALALVIYFAQR